MILVALGVRTSVNQGLPGRFFAESRTLLGPVPKPTTLRHRSELAAGWTTINSETEITLGIRSMAARCGTAVATLLFALGTLRPPSFHAYVIAYACAR